MKFNFHLLNILMIRSGMKAGELATEVGVTERSVREWMSGKGDPRIDRLPGIAKAFKVEQSEFLKEIKE